MVVGADGEVEIAGGPSRIPTSLEPPRGEARIGYEVPLQSATSGSDGLEFWNQKMRDEAERLIARTLEAASRMSDFDEGPRDRRPDEIGRVIVCTPTLQGELSRDPEGRIVHFAQREDHRLYAGMTIAGDKETYYDEKSSLVLDRRRGTLTYHYEVPDDSWTDRSRPYPF